MIEAPAVRCSRCHTPLKMETVWVSVFKIIPNEVTGIPEKVWDKYEEKTEVSDCPRCHGSY